MKHYLTRKIREDRNKKQEENGKRKVVNFNSKVADSIAEKIIKYFPGLTIEEMTLETRIHELFIPRQLWIYFSVMCYGFSHKAVSIHVGSRDHSSIYNAIKKLEYLCDVSSEYSNRVEKIFFNEIIVD